MRQLLLFQENIEDIQERKVNQLIEKYENVRKSQFAKISGLEKRIKELEFKLNFIESYICKGCFKV